MKRALLLVFLALIVLSSCHTPEALQEAQKAGADGMSSLARMGKAILGIVLYIPQALLGGGTEPTAKAVDSGWTLFTEVGLLISNCIFGPAAYVVGRKHGRKKALKAS